MTKRRFFIFFTCIFIVSVLFQGIQWKEFDMVDSGIWGNEARYVLDNDPREFNFLAAYGHPGGPIIEGAIVLHALFDLPYDTSVLVLVTLLNSLFVAGACVLAVLLRRGSLWWIVVLGTLSLNRLYDYATPPSAVVTVIIAFLCLLTLYIFEKKERLKPAYLICWGIVSGLAIATRADVGLFSSAVFLALLVPRIGWRVTALLIGEAVLVFAIFDPFMWFMPVQHLKDLVFKIVYHYADFAPAHLGLTEVVTFSSIAFVSMFLSVQFLLLRKRIMSPLPPLFIGALLSMAGAFYVVFLTADYQATRYFLPILFIWEMFLPLFIFWLIDAVQFSFMSSESSQFTARRVMKWFVVVLIYFYHSASFVLALSIASAFHILPQW